MHCRQRVGLLGGSFNPAHAGHLHISREAIRRLELDEVWWIVSPRNPLKPLGELEDYATRLAQARVIAAAEPRIVVTAIEHALGTRYTIDTLRQLKRRYSRVCFAWLMGADNLAQFRLWKQWIMIFSDTRIAVFDRAPFSHTALRAKAALRFTARRVPAGVLMQTAPPAWAYVHMRRDPHSATALRHGLSLFPSKILPSKPPESAI
ncbi:MAG: nicotinate-nicotinamide nucleotide adenylyltransferase [Alphaproteobacteria bacterium]|nr:nicotinate-nicotinamide nucleotide adenylyltransferase [Alphaproteobacteria bacterium]